MGSELAGGRWTREGGAEAGSLQAGLAFRAPQSTAQAHRRCLVHVGQMLAPRQATPPIKEPALENLVYEDQPADPFLKGDRSQDRNRQSRKPRPIVSTAPT